MLDHLGQVAQAAAEKFGDKEALVFEGRSFSFNELNTMIEAVAGGLAGLGLAKGDVITLYAANSWEWIVSYYAIARLGAVINPVNTMLTLCQVTYGFNRVFLAKISITARRIRGPHPQSGDRPDAHG